MVRIENCTSVDRLMSIDAGELPNLSKTLSQAIGMFSVRGPSAEDHYQGHRSFVTPVRFSYDAVDRAVGPLNALLRSIYDERNGRCIAVFYPDSDAGKIIASTLNIASPSF